jgi:probable HAF family extracellular repeat protein
VGYRRQWPVGIGTTPNRAFIWNERDGLMEIPAAPHPAGPVPLVRSTAQDVNDLGQVTGVVSYRLVPPLNGCCEDFLFVWDRKKGMKLLGNLGGRMLGVTMINLHGLMVGAADIRQPLPGEVLRNPLNFLSNVSDVPTHAFRWSPEQGLEDLGTLGGQHSVAWGLDDAGNAYGWSMNAAGEGKAVKWTTTGQVILMGTLPGGAQSQAGAGNHQGVIAGTAEVPGGFHAVLFVPK